MEESALQNGFDPSSRELCPDCACIGVIGPDGKCKECGTPSPNGPPSTPEAPEEVEKGSAEEDQPESTDQSAATPPPEGVRAVEGDEFDPSARELCPDGACIGVIGPDGACKECGRAAE